MSVETHAHSNPHHEHPDVVGSRNRLGVILILVADITFALGVVFVYFYLKGQNVNGMWMPPASDTQSATSPVSSAGAWTLALIAGIGLLAHRYALMGARAKSQSQLVLGSGLAVVVSVVGLIYQGMQISSASFTITMGTYASCYYLIAGLNFMHFAFTVFISLGNWNRSRLGLYDADHWHVVLVEIWWVWMTMSAIIGAFALSFT